MFSRQSCHRHNPRCPRAGGDSVACGSGPGVEATQQALCPPGQRAAPRRILLWVELGPPERDVECGHFQKQGLSKANQLRVRSLDGVLTQQGWCPYQKDSCGHRDRHTQKEDNVKTERRPPCDWKDGSTATDTEARGEHRKRGEARLAWGPASTLSLDFGLQTVKQYVSVALSRPVFDALQ